MAQEHGTRFGGTCTVVTGASSGIGAAVARTLCEGGGKVILAGRSQHRLRLTAESLPSGLVHLAVGDLANGTGLESILRETSQGDWNVTGLANCAGRTQMGRAKDVDSAVLGALLAVNLHAPLLLAAQLVKSDQGSRLSSIVNISSIAASGSAPYQAMYAASKAALEGATRSMAAEWGPRGTRVNAVAPGVIETPMSQEIWADPEWRGAVEGRIPLRRLGTDQDVANVVAFLISRDSAYVCGQTIVVDGGLAGSYSIGP